MKNKDIARLCKLIESAINLIVDGFKTSEDFLFPMWVKEEGTAKSSTAIIDVSLYPSLDCYQCIERINLTIAGETQEIIIQSEDGENLWDSLNPLADRVEEAVLKLVIKC